jgi:hypothetical protein
MLLFFKKKRANNKKGKKEEEKRHRKVVFFFIKNPIFVNLFIDVKVMNITFSRLYNIYQRQN